MKNDWLNRWDNRYRNKEYAYGIEPNKYLKEQLAVLNPGKILFAAEGEGRNAIYAAKSGWDTYAFDISTEGKNKALQLAAKNNVSIDYQVGLLPELNYNKQQFDTIALIYAHFPPDIKSEYHKILDMYLKKGGAIIFEAFSKGHIDYRLKNNKIGGPSDLESLFSIDELKSDFKNYDIIELVEKEIELKEGLYHNGKGSVIRFVGVKK